MKAGVNLGMVENMRANKMAVGGDLESAETTLREGMGRLKELVGGLNQGGGGGEVVKYLEMGKGLVMKMQTMLGQVLVGEGKMEEAEAVFRTLTKDFPEEAMSWMGLGRILDMMGGNEEEIKRIKAKVLALGGGRG